MLKLIKSATCLDCQYLHMPNPDEDKYICLKTLKKVLNELDETFFCQGFEEVQPIWIPTYITESENYI